MAQLADLLVVVVGDGLPVVLVLLTSTRRVTALLYWVSVVSWFCAVVFGGVSVVCGGFWWCLKYLVREVGIDAVGSVARAAVVGWSVFDITVAVTTAKVVRDAVACVLLVPRSL